MREADSVSTVKTALNKPRKGDLPILLGHYARSRTLYWGYMTKSKLEHQSSFHFPILKEFLCI
jgi:hypothetical protein